MKKLVPILLLGLFMALPMYSLSKANPSNPEVMIPESETKKFTDDPIAYISDNFDITKQPAFADAEVDTKFRVTFKCSKGTLVAKYDSRGNLLYTKQRFKDISMPTSIMAEVHREYPGWSVSSIKYRANGRGEALKSARYDVFLQKEDQETVFTKKIRYEGATAGPLIG